MRSTTRNRVRMLFAAIAIGALGALACPALAATAEPTTTIRGDVHLGAAALGDYRVGFFDSTDGSVISGTTASDGTFSLPVPSDATGFAFAGSDPSAQRAISAYRGRNVVRGVIGLHAPTGIAGAIYQSLTAGSPDRLGDGGAIHFRLQHSGRLTGTGNLPKGSEITIERLDGARVGAASADAHGTFRTPALVPGRYLLVFRGGTSLLARTEVVTVVADRTVRVSVPHLVKGGVLQGTVTSGGKPVTQAVSVIVSVPGGEVVRQGTTSTKGVYRFVRLAARTYTVTFADNPPAFTDDGGPANQPGSDDYLHSIRHATIPEHLGRVILNPTVARAGKVTAVAPKGTTSVVVERPDDGSVVRSTVRGAGTFTVGGLATGRYTVFAMTKRGDLARRTVAVTAGRTTRLGTLVTSGPAPSVSGTVSGSKRGTVTLQPERAGYLGPQIGTSIAKDGTFTVTHAFPGTYPATAGGRTQNVTIAADGVTTLHLTGDDADGTLGIVVRIDGNQLQDVTGSATDTAGDVVGFGSRYATEFATEAPSGTYSFQNRISGFDVDQQRGPAVDGPWWYNAPVTGFTIAPNATTHVVAEVTIGP